tara:strand:+ start:17497 stop:18261 length:765 start_codon:yes stop_codon:yes gene_type:complete
MRIISNFRDYYDCVQAHGQDQGFVYVRNPETLNFAYNEWTDPDGMGIWSFPYIRSAYSRSKFYLTEHIIGFCGKIYPVIELRKEATSDPVVCYNVEDVVNFINGAGFKKKEIEEFNGAGKKRYNYWRTNWHDPNKKTFEKFFAKCVEQHEQHEGIFLKSGCPIFVATYRDRWRHSRSVATPTWKPSTITFNGELKGLGFYKIFSTALAYQEISMYLGGVLGTGNPPVPDVSNNDLIEAKGFNLKTSFRKEKEKK